jgi:transitional endoplasmic reticulum ATPase
MGSQLTERWVGAGTENIDRMFKEAIENEPVLLFLDEIDAIAPERGGADQHQDQTRQVNALLEWISKIYDEEYDVVIIGATNRRDQIDDAMLRSGRLTTEIEVPYPDEKARVEIFETHLEAPTRNLRLNEVADASEGLSAADMEAVATEAARIALERDEPVDTDDVLTAIDRIDTNKSRNR